MVENGFHSLQLLFGNVSWQVLVDVAKEVVDVVVSWALGETPAVNLRIDSKEAFDQREGGV